LLLLLLGEPSSLHSGLLLPRQGLLLVAGLLQPGLTGHHARLLLLKPEALAVLALGLALARGLGVGGLLRDSAARESGLLLHALLHARLELLPLLEALLLLEVLLLLELLLLEALLLDALLLVALVDDLVGVDGGLDDALGEVLLSMLDDGDGPLAVDDGLDLVNHVGDHLLLYDGRALNHTAHVGGWGLLDVLLDVMDDVLVDFTVDDWLHLNHAVLPDGLLDDGGVDDGGGLLSHMESALSRLAGGLALASGLSDGGLLIARLSRRQSLVVVGTLVLLAVVGEFVQKTRHVGLLKE